MNSKKVPEFSSIISSAKILEYLKAEGFKKPTNVQQESIPLILEGHDLTIQGKTGSGKTLSYLLPVIQLLKQMEEADANEDLAAPRVVILLPTRELALQVFSVAKSITHFAKLRVRKLLGGDKGKVLTSLFSSQIDILVTTPDRCLRSFEQGDLSTVNLKKVVLDEADQLLEPSFFQTVSLITDKLVKKHVQVILVSASRPENFNQVLETYFPQKKLLLVGKGEENLIGHKVKTYNIAVEEHSKFSYTFNFVKGQGKRNGLIFTGNKARAKKVHAALLEKGHQKAFLIHKDLLPKERIAVVDAFRKKGGILVATDVFARGMDVNHLEWVLNFDLPSAPDYYLHRSGRVGRAGRSGEVFNFVTSRDDKRQTRINETLITQGRRDLKITNKSQRRPK